MSVLTATAYAFGYYVLGPLIKLWVRGIELRAQAIAAATPDFDDEPVVEDIPPSVNSQLRRIERQFADVPTYEQLADLYLIPEETR